MSTTVLEIVDLDEGYEINGHDEPNSNIEMKLHVNITASPTGGYIGGDF